MHNLGITNLVLRLGSYWKDLTNENYKVGITHGVLLLGHVKFISAEEIIPDAKCDCTF